MFENVEKLLVEFVSETKFIPEGSVISMEVIFVFVPSSAYVSVFVMVTVYCEISPRFPERDVGET